MKFLKVLCLLVGLAMIFTVVACGTAAPPAAAPAEKPAAEAPAAEKPAAEAPAAKRNTKI